MRTWPVLLWLVVPLIVACRSSEAGSDRPVVVGAVYPLEFVAEGVGGEAADVKELTPAGQEPHDIELTSDQVVDVSGAEVLLYIGDGFQPALEDVVSEVDGETIDALEEVEVLRSGEQIDPHVWLDPHRLSRIAGVVAARLSELDPEDRDTYDENAQGLVAELQDLDSDYAAALDDCDSRELVTAHEAFGYLADRYDLQQIGIAGIDPEAEPSPQRLVDVADFVREHDVDTIFFEELVSPDVAETIADETGARTASLDPLESPPSEGDYVTAMRANLATLQDALGCK
jgi:zinc transport system substrate-binding protein